MSRVTRIGFVHVLLAMAIMLVGLTSARAVSLSVVVSTSLSPGMGTPVNCPLQLPSTTTLPLPASITNFFNCIVTISGAGTFQVFGAIFAMNLAEAGVPGGFNSSLAYNATVATLSPVTASVSVSISVTQFYTIPNSSVVSSVLSSVRIDGACNTPVPTPVSSFDALTFMVNLDPFPIPPPSVPCPILTEPPIGVPLILINSSAPSGNLISLGQAGGVVFLPGSPVGDAVDLEMQQVAYPPTGGAGIAFSPPPPTPTPVCTLPAPGSCSDFMNQFIPPPDPSTGFVIIYLGDVRSDINIASMVSDPTINPFAYQHPGLSNASMSLDSAGNTEVTFSGPALSSSDIYCYNGPSTCNNNPHIGVNAVAAPACVSTTNPTLQVLGQYWTNAPVNSFPSMSVAGPCLTGPATSFVTLFADVKAGGNTVGQWFEKPYSTNAPPQLCLSNNTAEGETLSNVGFLVTPVAILQSMNFGIEPPPGQPGSTFTNLPSLDGRFLPSGGSVCFTPPIKPDISVTNGDPSGKGTLTVVVNLNNTGGTDASNVRITSIKSVSPATYVGPVLPVTVGNITAGTTDSQNIQINVQGMAPGSIARFQINGSYQDSAGNNFQFSSVRGVQVP